MDFLNKIKKRFFNNSKETFQDIIKREKQQKYLFQNQENTYVSPRKKKGIFSTLNSFRHNHPVSSHKKTFLEKYFQTHTKEGEKDLRFWMGLIGVFLLILVGYIVIVSPYFRISPNKILIESLSDGVDINIVHRSVESIHGNSLFSLDEALLAKNIKENLNNVEYIKIDKLYPNGVKILIKSLPIHFDTIIFGVNNKRWGISSNGVLVPISDINSEKTLRHLELISDSLQSELFLNYKKVLSDKEMFIIEKIFKIFDTEWVDLKIARATYFLNENELHITLESNTKIIFSIHNELQNLKQDITSVLAEQFVTFKTYLSHNYEKLIDGNLFYLDARIPGKIFTCTQIEQCRKNLINIYGKVYE